MQKSKLFRLLKTLSSTEMKRFSKFVQSPFFNTNPSIINLYKILRKAYPNFEDSKLQKEKVYKKIFPTTPFNYHHFGNLLSEMTRLVEEFLIHLELEDKDIQRRKILVEAYGKRNIYDFFEKESRKLMHHLEQQPYRDTGYFRDIMDIKSTFFFHPNTQRYVTKEDFPQEIMDLLDKYFALSKMQMAANLKSRAKILSATYDIKMLQPALEYSQMLTSEKYPLFSIYSSLHSFLNHPEKVATFYSLKNNFEENIGILKKEEQRDVLQHLINYGIGKINSGQFEYNQEVLSLYKLGLENDLILQFGKIRESTYLNISDIAGVLGEFDWGEKFLEAYAPRIDKDKQAQIKAFGFAKLKFRQKDFDGVIDIINQEHFNITVLEVSIRFLVSKAWFEKYLLNPDLYEFMISQIETNEKYFRRSDVLNAVKIDAYLNYFKIIKRIVNGKMRLKIDEEFKESMLRKIKNTSPLMGKVWLAEKIKVLKIP